MLTDDLMERLKTRAGDPATRTDRYDQPGGRRLFGGVFETRVVSVDGTAPAAPDPLPAPAESKDVRDAETRLGRELPADLKQLYTSIANGGFGPGEGLASLDVMADRYLALCAEPQGEGWPALAEAPAADHADHPGC